MMGQRRLALLTLLPAAALAGLLSTAHAQRRSQLNLPPLLPMERFGDVILKGASRMSGQSSVLFSHVIHRGAYTCRVCHLELGFAMKANGTPAPYGRRLPRG